MKTIVWFFDKLEDMVRRWLSRRPILYGFIGGAGMVLFWRGVWYAADVVHAFIFATPAEPFQMGWPAVWEGPVSIIVGSVMLLISGIFVSTFIGNEIIISGLRGEKKLVDKTEAEIRTDTGAIGEIREEVRKISARLDEMSKKK